MMPKLPEPDLCEGVAFSKKGKYVGTFDGYTHETVRAIQEEAYRAGMDAAKCPVCSGMGTYDGDNGEIINPCDECDGTGFWNEGKKPPRFGA